MKRSYLLATMFCICHFSFSQTSYNVTWGEEIKLKKGTADLDIVAADNTGLYFSESRLAMKSYFVIGATFGESIKLIKMDKNFNEVYDNTFKKELKGLTFHSFQPLENDLYMFATDYIKKERRFVVYGAKVDKNSGELMGDFIELGSYDLESKRDDYEMRVSPVQGGKAFLMVSNISNNDRVSLGVNVLDKNLKRKESAIINLSFTPNQYALQDVKYTRDNKIVLLGKEYEETVYGKKKRKRLVFKQYDMAVYDKKGKKEASVNMDADNRYIISGRLIEQPTGEMLLAGFYSNEAKKENLNGFYINKVDPIKGELLLSSYKEINTGMLGKSFVDESDDDDLSKEEKKEAKKAKDDDDEDDFPNSFIIRSVDINPADNSIIITSEVSKYTSYTYTTSSYNSATKSWTYRTTTVHKFTNEDILVINADKDGKINWLNALPKSQIEQISASSSNYGGFSISYDYTGYFANGGALPYYSSYKSLLSGNKLVIIMNDHNSNNVNPGYGDKVKSVYNFRKRSSVYGISIDLATGKMTRKNIATNNDETIMMPRHAYIVGNEFFVPSWRQHAMAKTEMKFAKITVK
jgi:hypothetical protein